jgi:hypothetical protein
MLHRILRRRSNFGTRRGEEVKEAADGGPEAIDGSLGGLAQERLELGEGVVFQWPCGTPRRRRSPRRQRPWVRAILVEAQVSSMNTSISLVFSRAV